MVTEIDETYRLVHTGHIEKRELLLIAQHLEGWFADHAEIQGRTIVAGQGEHDLLRERGLPGAGRTGDQIEGEFRQAPADHLVKPRHARGELSNHDSVGHARVSPAAASEKPSGHA